MIQKQKRIEWDVTVSTVLFNDKSVVLHNRVKLQDYQVKGSTALLDEVGRSIIKIKKVYCDTLRENRPDKGVFIITTDGMENTSNVFIYKSLKKEIERVKEEYNWEFVFIGANIDSKKEASRMGIESH